MSMHKKWTGGDLLFHDGSTNIFKIRTSANGGITLGDGVLDVDLKLFGSAVGNYLTWDASANDLIMTGDHFEIKTADDSKCVRINSRDYAVTSGDIIGFQSKPAGNGDGTATVYGGQISPRFNDAVGGAALVGLQVETILKGATAKAVSGDIRALDVRLTTDGAGHTVGGDTAGIKFYNLLASSTYTGGVYPIVVTAHGSTQAWSGFAKFADDSGVVADLASAVSDTVNGAIKVVIGSTTCYIPTYDGYTPA
jgi:hypothetical protein